MKLFIIPICLILCSLLTSCKTIDVRGQYIDDSQVSILEDKKMTKNDITEMLGLPTIVPNYTENVWYYASRSMERKIWTKPKIESQRIVMIKFDTSDNVQEVEVFDNSHSHDVRVISEYTKSVGNESNAVQQFVKNFGRFNKAPKSKKRRHGAQ